MTRSLRALSLVSFVFLMAGASGCKPSDAAFCGKMRELYGEDMNDCEKDALPEVKAKCGAEAEAVMKCMMNATTKDAAETCFKPCEAKKG